MEINDEFAGVYYFTNPTKMDRKYLWNNKEYTFPAESRVPLIIMGEPLENIQEIRKRFAYRMAEERFYEGEVPPTGEDYIKMKEMGRGLPPTFDPRILEPFIEECLKPLPIKRGTIKEGKKTDDESKYKATKAGFVSSPAEVFKEDENRYAVGQMPDRPM